MLYSKLFGKTKKEAPKDEESLNAKLLIRGGFIEKEMAGVYAFLPLGLLVMGKISQIIRQEMNAIGGQELFLGSLQNPDTWAKTNRWSDEVIDVWFKTKLHSGTEIGLATTHEEPLTEIMTRHIQSYKDLPLYVYQFQNKFRNEIRARSGLIRTREFIMKDLYSFNKTLEDLDSFYELAKEAYTKIFNRIGIGDKTFLTFASGKPFSKYSHEFQTVCERGEDTIYLDQKKKIAVNKEVLTDEVLNDLGLKKDESEKVNSIEVGNIFKLGTKYSEPLGLFYTDEDGKQKPVVMGSYGIGPARAMATVVEVFNDEKGIVWPRSISPFLVHLVGLDLHLEKVRKQTVEVYEKLLKEGVEVLFDDRKETTAGEKFADADLIGIPYRVVVSEKTGDKVEIKERSKETTDTIGITELLSKLNLK